MLAVRTSFGQSRYQTGEWDAVFGTQRGFRKQNRPALWCHGNNSNATLDYTTYATQLRQFAQSHFVMIADLGGNTFGNDTGIARAGTALDYLDATWGLDEPVVFIAASMGATVAFNYAVRFPERVVAIAGIIPALTLDAPADNPAKPNIDLAYPPAYDPEDPDDLAHDPTAFAADLPADMPVHLWTSSDDPVCLPEYTTAYLAERPQTGHTDIGPHGHGGIDVAAPLVAEWIKEVAA